MSQDNYESLDNDQEEKMRKRQEERKKRREEKRKQEQQRNKIILGVIAGLIILFFIFGISSCASSCSSGGAENNKDTQPPTAQPTQPPTQPPTEPPTSPPIKDNGEDGYLTEQGVYVWDNKGFELFYGDEEMAKTYANAVSHYRGQLDSSINVYNMVVPTHIAFGLPDRLEATVGSYSQPDYINNIYNNITADVKTVNVTDSLENHKTEYCYFNTDHHWTALGAYYAYKDFCKTAGETAVNIDNISANSVQGFVGSLYTATGLEVLQNNPDTVSYYEMPVSYSAQLMQSGSNELEDIYSMYYEAATAGSNTYGVYIWGDNPVTKIVNTEGKNGKKILVVKDSFGNALVPWLVNNYDQVHAIDFRYYDGNVAGYCSENGITDVLILNGVMSSANGFQIDNMSSVFGG
ncbi:MAG: DHHW family protein [Acutalibacteraceae bacterium]